MLDGSVPMDEKTKDVKCRFDQMCAHQPEFNDFPFDLTRCKGRVNRIQDAVKKLCWSSEHDKECHVEFRAAFPKLTHGPTGKPLWKDSEANRLLKEAMQQGLHLQMGPGDASFETNAVWAPFRKRSFSERIDQLKEVAKPCGCNPMQAAKKKERKDKTKIKDRPDISRAGGGTAPCNNSV